MRLYNFDNLINACKTRISLKIRNYLKENYFQNGAYGEFIQTITNLSTQTYCYKIIYDDIKK